MKKRILAYGLELKHAAISDLPNLLHPVSISDYDALIFDPLKLEYELRKASGAVHLAQTSTTLLSLHTAYLLEGPCIAGRKRLMPCCIEKAEL